MVRTGFGTDPVRTVVGAYHVLRANQLWAPYPHNDPDGARAFAAFGWLARRQRDPGGGRAAEEAAAVEADRGHGWLVVDGRPLRAVLLR